MAEPQKPDLQDPPKKAPFAVHGKSFRDIARDGNKRVLEGKPLEEIPKKEEKKPEEKPKEEKPKDNKIEDEAEKQRRDKAAADAADKAARDEARRIEKEKDEKSAKDAEEEKRKKDLEDKKTPPWIKDPNRPKDKDGNPLPKSYDEIKQAAVDQAKAEIREELRIEREQQEAERKAEQQRKEQETEEQKRSRETLEANITKQINDEYSDLVTSGKLPAIKDEKDEKDAGVVARKALFEAGVKVNTERMAKGLPPIASPKIIYYEHYKEPNKQPAGGDAPILGKEGGEPADEKPIVYGDIHRKSFRQILAEGIKRATGQGK